MMYLTLLHVSILGVVFTVDVVFIVEAVQTHNPVFISDAALYKLFFRGTNITSDSKFDVFQPRGSIYFTTPPFSSNSKKPETLSVFLSFLSNFSQQRKARVSVPKR